MRKILLALVLIAVLYSCQSDDKKKVDPNSTTTVESALAPDSNSLQPNPPSSTNLQDIWVLDSINNDPMLPEQFSHGTPYMELDTAANIAKGHTGCNSFNSSLKINGNKITFEKLVALKQVCNDKGFEKNFLKGLRSGNVTYKILNDKLYLNTGLNSVYVFRRIRR